MSRPREVLEALRATKSPDGSVVIADEGVAEECVAPAGEVERMMYDWSITLSLLPT